MLLRRTSVPTALALGLLTGTAAAQQDSPALAEITRLFDGLKLPPVAGKQMVLLNTGEANAMKDGLPLTRRVGWVLERSVSQLRLLHLDFRERTWTWPPDQRFDRLDAVRAAGGPAPGTYVQVDFGAYCQVLRDEAATKKARTYDAMDVARFPVEVRAAEAGFWARQLGKHELAENMAALALKECRVDPKSDYPVQRTLTGVLLSRIATEYRYRLTVRGHWGESSRELLWGWRLLAERLPTHAYTAYAKSMADGYAALIKGQTAARAAPSGGGASGTPQQQARYWLFMLRHQDTAQRGRPGFCRVIRPWRAKGATLNASEQLLALGRDAVPLLIEHLDDSRPTRCMTSGSVLGAVFLLRYGDCCHQILEAIRYGDQVGQKRLGKYPHYRPATVPALKRQWQAWWKAEQSK